MSGRLRVGDWTVVPELNCLERDGRSVRVEPKVMRVLVALAEKPGQVLSKENLLRQVWPETFVSDEVLTRCISELRKVFEDNPKEPDYIQTIPKGGYRLLAAVTTERGNKRIGRRHEGRRNRWLFAAGTGAVLLAAASAYFISRSAPVRPQITSLAILPLTNLSGDASQDYFSDGLTDELTTRLAKISALRVVSRTSAFRYKNTQKTAPEIARELNVDAVVEGSVLRSGNRVRISAQLILARTDQNVWAESYDRDLSDILALQADVAHTIAGEIRVKVTPQERGNLATAGTGNSDAYDSYLKGRYYWSRFNDADNQKAISYYQRAIEIDPNYALAYAGLADVYHEVSDVPPREVVPKSRAASEKALQLDESLAEAHSSLGWVKWIYYWDWPGAEAEFRRAIQLNPNYSTAHGMYAEYLDSMGRFAEAAKERETAKQLAPVEPILYHNSGEHFIYTRDFDKAIAQYKEALQLVPTFFLAHGGLSQAYALKGAWKECVQHMEESAEQSGHPELAARIKAANRQAGYRAAMQVQLENIRQQRSRGVWVASDSEAWFYLMLGQKDRALVALDQAVEEGDPAVTALQVDPVYDSIRSDPRFQALVNKVGLPQ